MTRYRLLVAAWMIGLGLATTVAPKAAAEPQTINEVVFIMTLDQGGIGFVSEDAAIAEGKNICRLFDQGRSVTVIGLTIARNSGLSLEKSGYFMGASVAAFCPRYEYLFET